jgi:hypothetical protein
MTAGNFSPGFTSSGKQRTPDSFKPSDMKVTFCSIKKHSSVTRYVTIAD